MLPMQSMAMAATTFVAQNVGARKQDRADDGTVESILLTLLINGALCTVLVALAETSMRLFTGDETVISQGASFIRVNLFFTLFNCVNQVLAGALRGRGDSIGPMVIMLCSFVLIRQTYLFCVTRFFANTPLTVGFGYPVGWMCCCVLELLYFYLHWKHRG